MPCNPDIARVPVLWEAVVLRGLKCALSAINECTKVPVLAASRVDAQASTSFNSARSLRPFGALDLVSGAGVIDRNLAARIRLTLASHCCLIFTLREIRLLSRVCGRTGICFHS